jgi:hypothetical protein
MVHNLVSGTGSRPCRSGFFRAWEKVDLQPGTVLVGFGRFLDAPVQSDMCLHNHFISGRIDHRTSHSFDVPALLDVRAYLGGDMRVDVERPKVRQLLLFLVAPEDKDQMEVGVISHGMGYSHQLTEPAKKECAPTEASREWC